jgi:transcriptional regulator NrdR family protein
VADYPVDWICDQCGGTHCKVIETRRTPNKRRRRIQCQSCGNRTTTYEITSAQLESYQAAMATLEKLASSSSVNSIRETVIAELKQSILSVFEAQEVRRG